MNPNIKIRRGLTEFNPKSLANLLEWHKFATGITITGAGVSQWNDLSGNGFHLVQATDTNRPSYNGGIITFDGVDNYLRVTFGVLKAQPFTVYLRARQVTWTNVENMDDSDGSQGGVETSISQEGITPAVVLYAGATACSNTNWPVDANFYSVCAVFNGASSSLRIGATAKTTGNVGSDGRGGTTLGANITPGNFANFAIKEYIVYNAAHNDATQSEIITYLNGIG